MSYLSMMEAKLPPGFRFHPRDEELVRDYLVKKISGDDSISLYGCPTMIDVDLNKCEPWDLPETARVGGKEWYFFSLRDRKYATGQRTNRATVSGYWKATGKDRHVVTEKGHLVGMRKTLVFYQGRAPKGRKSDWVMHEFRYEPSEADVSRSSIKEDWVLCRVFYKSRGHLSNKTSTGASYEEDTSCSSSLLPPLTTEESTYINFGQTPTKNLEQEFEGYYGYEPQVPCFSNTTYPTTINPTYLGGLPLPNFASGMSQLNSQFNCENNNKVIRAVLNHLTKLEADPTPPSLGEGNIDHCYLPKNGLSPIW